ncbi:MAG TPA: hypothetical protein VMV53_12175 [Acidimicrobiales bacterium]|nr:hypothetical protein [Acidimicrobiales bacterium]
MTVRGPIEPHELGFTLMHEHLLANTLVEYRGNGFMMDEDLAVTELGYFAEAGGSTMVDLTTVEIGRDPLALRRIAERAGVHVIMGSGHYRDPYLDEAWFDRTSVDEMADEIVREATLGVGESGVRCGIIGEIGVDRAFVSAREERSLRAAARAQLRTGLTISTHACRWPVGGLQLDILEHEGVAMDRVIIGHVDTVPQPGYALELVRRGCWIEFDGFGTDPDYDARRAVREIVDVAEAGFLGQIVVSQDVFLRSHLHAFGGRGYDYVALEFASLLGEVGLGESEFDQLTRENPRRALTGG